MRASLTEAETRFCHEKVGSPIKSKRGTTRAGPFLSATLPETSGKFGQRGRGRANPGSDDVVEESVERWREAGRSSRCRRIKKLAAAGSV